MVHVGNGTLQISISSGTITSPLSSSGLEPSFNSSPLSSGKLWREVVVVEHDVPNSFTMQIQLMKLSRKFDTRIEPHPFAETDFNPFNPFANEIIRHGIQIV